MNTITFRVFSGACSVSRCGRGGIRGESRGRSANATLDIELDRPRGPPILGNSPMRGVTRSDPPDEVSEVWTESIDEAEELSEPPRDRRASQTRTADASFDVRCAGGRFDAGLSFALGGVRDSAPAEVVRTSFWMFACRKVPYHRSLRARRASYRGCSLGRRASLGTI